jgi:hypothetical protein
MRERGLVDRGLLSLVVRLGLGKVLGLGLGLGLVVSVLMIQGRRLVFLFLMVDGEG